LGRYEADILLCTHTGLPWQRELPSGKRVINVGAIGRPANDGGTDVYYFSMTETGTGEVLYEFVPVSYDCQGLADDMRAENLPEEFVETILTGWWTTCLEIMPRLERKKGRF